MAVELPIQGGPEQAKLRNEWGVAGLALITLGIYGLVWWYKINREMADLGRKNGRTDLGTNPTMSLLALFPGAILIVPVFWTFITTYGRIKRTQQMVGVRENDQFNPVIAWVIVIAGLIIPFVSLGVYVYFQDALNKAWRAHTGYQSPGSIATAAQFQAAEPAAAPAPPPAPPAPPVPPAPPTV